MGKKLFLISGLGADKRAFANLHLNREWERINVEWITPLAGESVARYAARLAERYGMDNQSVIIGLSFGGLIAVEITKIVHPALTIIISSAATVKELPFLYRLAGALKLAKLIPAKVLNRPNRLFHRFFGLKKERETKLFDEIVAGSDPFFVKWALLQITTWKNTERPEQVVKIHGTKDRLLPIHKKSTDYVVHGGTHFLTWENAARVSEIINRLLSGLQEKTGRHVRENG